MLLKTLLALTLLAHSLQTQPSPTPPPTDANDFCPIIKYFGGTSSPYLSTNTTPYCRNLHKTCCSPEDFLLLNSWWTAQRPQLYQHRHYPSRQKLRQKHLQLIHNTVIELFTLKSEITLTIKDTLRSHPQHPLDPTCKTAFESYLNLNLPSTINFIETFKNAAKNCWTHTNNLQGSFLCSFCDPRSTEELFIDQTTLRMKLKGQNCYDLIQHCGDISMLNVNQVFPYLTA
jgi:hypothetical protein